MTRQLKPSDLDLVRDWYVAKGIHLERDTLPKVGFMSNDVAVAFLIQTDTSSAFIELVADPSAEPELRDACLDIVVQCCSEAAKKLGFKHLMGFSTMPRVISRAERLGFTVGRPYTLLTLSLT